MQRITLADAERDFSNLVHRICAEGEEFELARDGTVVARLLPALRRSSFLVQDLRKLLADLPALGDDAGAFDADLSSVRREYPAEKGDWV